MTETIHFERDGRTWVEVGPVATLQANFPGNIPPDTYEVALFEGELQVSDWVSGPPCEFRSVCLPGPDRYKVRIPDGRVYAGPMPCQATGGNITFIGRFHWGEGFPARNSLYRER